LLANDGTVNSYWVRLNCLEFQWNFEDNMVGAATLIPSSPVPFKMPNLRLAIALSLALFFPIFAQASIVHVASVDSGSGGTIVGNVFTSPVVSLTDNGVNFDIQWTVTGSGGTTVNNNSNGIGVDGTTVNAGEQLSFGVSILSQSGGTVSFDGFTEIDFNSNTAAGGDELTINGVLVTGGANLFDLTIAPYLTPTSLIVAGQASSTGSTSFQIDDVSLQFTGTASIPEPTSLVMFGSALIGMLVRRRR